jgi:hypothetical protein
MTGKSKVNAAAVLVQLKFIQRADNNEEFKWHCQELHQLTGPKLYQYFNNNWFCNKWRPAWVNKDRPGE